MGYVIRKTTILLCLLSFFVTFSSPARSHILSDREYTAAESLNNMTGNEPEKQCHAAEILIKPEDDTSTCSKEELRYGARVLTSYRAGVAAIHDGDFTAIDYAAAASSRAPSDLTEAGADQAACAVALSDGYFGGPDHLVAPTHPPSCTEAMVAYGMNLLREYDLAIHAEDKIP